MSVRRIQTRSACATLELDKAWQGNSEHNWHKNQFNKRLPLTGPATSEHTNSSQSASVASAGYHCGAYALSGAESLAETPTTV